MSWRDSLNVTAPGYNVTCEALFVTPIPDIAGIGVLPPARAIFLTAGSDISLRPSICRSSLLYLFIHRRVYKFPQRSELNDIHSPYDHVSPLPFRCTVGSKCNRSRSTTRRARLIHQRPPT